MPGTGPAATSRSRRRRSRRRLGRIRARGSRVRGTRGVRLAGRRGAEGALRLAAVSRRSVLPGRRDGAACAARDRAARPARAGSHRAQRSRVHAVHSFGTHVRVEAEGGHVIAGSAVLALGAASVSVPALSRHLTLTSSHIVITEPVPDVLEEIGWTGGECISDSRALIHYFRTTPDGRIAFGWGGGGWFTAPGSTAAPSSTPRSSPRWSASSCGSSRSRRSPDRARVGWADRRIADPPPGRRVVERPSALRARIHRERGRPVAPRRSHPRLAGARQPRRVDPFAARRAAPRAVPPEPLRYLGGAIVRRAMVRKERLEEQGRDVDPLTLAMSFPRPSRDPHRSLAPARGEDLLARVELDRVEAVGVQVALHRVLQPANGNHATGAGTPTLTPTIPASTP